MSDEIPFANLSNARRLYEDAAGAYRFRRYATATFLSIIAVEEMAKCVINFCREHLDEKTFRRRFQHPVKHQVALTIWYTAGRVHVAYLMHHAAQSGLFEEAGPAAEAVGLHISQMAGWGNPKAIAEAIAGNLIPNPDPEVARRSDESNARTESLRRQSLYVDDDGQDVISSPSEITKEIAKERLLDAKFAIAVCSFVLSAELDYPEYLRALPRARRTAMIAEAVDMVVTVQAAAAEHRNHPAD